MSRRPTVFILAALALALAPVPFPRSALAASSDAASTPMARPVPVPVWVHPPEAVRTATAALHDACAEWPKQVPLASEPPAPLPVEADQIYVSSCQLSLDPQGFGQFPLLEGGLLGAAAAGIGALVFKLANFLLFGLVEAAGRSMNALWDVAAAVPMVGWTRSSWRRRAYCRRLPASGTAAHHGWADPAPSRDGDA